jgi:RNA polymerase sigma factor (TIGR02999 family)
LDPSISSLIAAAESGDRSVAPALFSALYAELHRVAKRELARRGAATSLGATTLLHEAYLDMSRRSVPDFPDEARFMGYAARVMRGLIIDHARSRRATKRGGQFELTALGTDVPENRVDARELVELSDALDALATTDASLAEIVDLKFFCGFSFAEIAAMRGASERSIQRHWERARIHLHRTLRSQSRL